MSKKNKETNNDQNNKVWKLMSSGLVWLDKDKPENERIGCSYFKEKTLKEALKAVDLGENPTIKTEALEKVWNYLKGTSKTVDSGKTQKVCKFLGKNLDIFIYRKNKELTVEALKESAVKALNKCDVEEFRKSLGDAGQRLIQPILCLPRISKESKEERMQLILNSIPAKQ